uniref:Ubiquitin carboxyl-terminal hydrolase n=1 Tax=Plectus sambesii TaxID=2011161 RepID=A0A914W0Z9_9BILA
MSAGKIDVPFSQLTPHSKVYKDECMYCFHTPEFPGGLYICLKTFFGFCERHVSDYANKSESLNFLHFARKRIKKESSEPKEPEEKITKLAIGVEGGFASDSSTVEFEDTYTFTQYPDFSVKYPLDESLLSERLLSICNQLAANEGAFRMQQLDAGVCAWDGTEKIVTKHANLVQCENPPKIGQSGWKCAECELTTNLWLNLTDGVIKCGRKQYVGPGVVTEGNEHMRQHYQQTKHPLVVKLGTITATDADLYSYDEDESVTDPNLAAHLAHFGLKMTDQEKTEKSTLELTLDLNQKWEYLAIMEEGSTLEGVYGPGHTGLVNLGSSCYINSSLQALCLVPEIRRRFGDKAAELFGSLPVGDVQENFNAQMTKLVHALMSGDYSKKADSDKAEVLNGIRPMQFRRLVGRGHPEFSTAKQQDAEEYIRYLFEKLEANTAPDETNPVDAFRFELENRLVDSGSMKVRYSTRTEVILPLMVSLDLATNKDAVAEFEKRKAVVEAAGQTIPPEQTVRPKIPLLTCLETFVADERLDDFKSPVTGERSGAVQRLRFQTFPDYLIVQAKRFTVSADYTPIKLDVELIVPDHLELEHLRGKGAQPGEDLLPEDDDAAAGPQVDADVVEQLVAMGFPATAARKAVHLTGNKGLEPAAEWVMMHMDDPDYAQEHPDFTNKRGNKAGQEANAEAVDQLVALGFTPRQAKYALRQNDNDSNRAAEWLFTSGDQVPEESDAMDTSPPTSAEKRPRDGPGSYRLVGFISHMGTSTHSGHYVAHLLKDGQWVIFNDEKVALSQKPPIEFGYLYLYERVV